MLKSAQRSFWIILVVLIASVALFVVAVVDGTGLAVVISAAWRQCFFIAWSRLAFQSDALSETFAVTDLGRSDLGMAPHRPGVDVERGTPSSVLQHLFRIT